MHTDLLTLLEQEYVAIGAVMWRRSRSYLFEVIRDQKSHERLKHNYHSPK